MLHFRAFYLHPSHGSPLRAERATHLLTPGKRGAPPTSSLTLHWPLVSRRSPLFRATRRIKHTHPPRAAFRLGRRAGLLVIPNYERPSARSRHIEFTTGSPDFCNRIWNLLSFWESEKGHPLSGTQGVGRGSIYGWSLLRLLFVFAGASSKTDYRLRPPRSPDPVKPTHSV